MKTATTNLVDDHVHILKLTNVMKAITLQEKPDISDVSSIVDIIRNFADGLHHSKEENLLFPAMEEKGFSSKQGPVAVMLLEHVRGRSFVKGINDNLESYKKGDVSAVRALYQNMNGYADLLDSHITKENNILFRMADMKFSEAEQENLLKKFEELDQSRDNGTKSTDYINRINNLALVYNL
jgi:hemerythrin-like domain-containing protein